MNGNQVAVKIATTLIARETAKKFLLKWRFDNRKQYQKAAISIYAFQNSQWACILATFSG